MSLLRTFLEVIGVLVSGIGVRYKFLLLDTKRSTWGRSIPFIFQDTKADVGYGPLLTTVARVSPCNSQLSVQQYVGRRSASLVGEIAIITRRF